MEEKTEEEKTGKVEELKQKVKKNPYIISTIILALLSIILLIMVLSPGITGNVISESSAGDKLTDYLNSKVGGGVELVDVEDLGNLYEVNVLYQGEEIPVYISKDGGYFIQGIIPITQATNTPTTPTPTNIPKSDKPEVELFVMTHCPYGTQAEKGFLPTIVALGDKIDASIKFVHYFLHDPEYTETPIQICIREEQGSKFNTYLKEFLVEGDTDAALAKAGVDKTKLNDCIENRYESLYASDSALSEGYGVRGSPTLVVNGVIAQSGRSADAYLQTICSAFNDAPSECSSLDLDTATPSPGFGYGTTSSVANAQC